MRDQRPWAGAAPPGAVYRVDVVSWPIEQCSGQAFCAEGFGPFVEWQVAFDHRGAALIALRDQLEQELGTGLGQWHEAQFVDDQQLDGCHLLLDAEQTALIAGLHQFVEQGSGGGEAD